MNQPCNCEVKPLFNGQLVFASNVILYDCYSNVTVRRSDQNDDTFAISCPTQYTSKVYSVSNISVFEISSDYLTRTRTGDTGFHHSIQIFQGMGLIYFWHFPPTKLVIYTFNAYIFRYNLKCLYFCHLYVSCTRTPLLYIREIITYINHDFKFYIYLILL